MASSKVSEAYQHSGSMSLQPQAVRWLTILCLTLTLLFLNSVYPIQLFASNNSKLEIRVATWNMAAINNNPFEYWISTDLEAYNTLMVNVSDFVLEPGDRDQTLGALFSDVMFGELLSEMASIPLLSTGTSLETVKDKWKSDYSSRTAIAGYLKDSAIGKKRLASMPDRLTNTISSADGTTLTRPTVINCYSGDLSSTALWWAQWRDFMFRTDVEVVKKGVQTKAKVVNLLVPISRAKYPAVTEEEAAASLPLQLLCLALFDLTLVHTLNTASPGSVWQPVRETLCQRLNRRKPHRTAEILVKEYSDSTALFLQEVGSAFLRVAGQPEPATFGPPLTDKYEVHLPANRDGDRDQNSVILLRRGDWTEVREVTADVLSTLRQLSGQTQGKAAPLARGDLLALTARRKIDGRQYLLCSFHGDTNGYATPEKDQLGVHELAAYYTSKGLNSCYGPHPDIVRNVTTCHARTYLQPQLNKAVSLADKERLGDRNPKDFILFFAADFAVKEVKKDNTGRRGLYVDGKVFPTLNFPSDHAITSTVLEPQGLGTGKSLRHTSRHSL